MGDLEGVEVRAEEGSRGAEDLLSFPFAIHDGAAEEERGEGGLGLEELEDSADLPPAAGGAYVGEFGGRGGGEGVVDCELAAVKGSGFRFRSKGWREGGLTRPSHPA